MSLIDAVRTSMRRSIALYQELITQIPESALGLKLPGLRSNTLGQQLWCVIGARESYGRAIAAGEWAGFTCSVTGDQCMMKGALDRALASSGAGLLQILAGGESFSDAQNRLLLDALEHEAAHQGQMIRYLYALNLPIPEGWKSRYALR